MKQYLWCGVSLCSVKRYSGIPRRGPVSERLALGDHESSARLRPLCGAALVFRLHYALKVPWAARLLAGPGR